jgi:hypothetical protein
MLSRLINNRSRLIILFLSVNAFANGQQNIPDSTLIGQRIIMLSGRGEVNIPDKNGILHIEQAPNIVAPVARVEENKVWILSPGEVEPGGWVDKRNIILLTKAISYFDSILEKNPTDWDSYLRKAEAEHSLNKRDAAITDYTTAIKLHPNDTYLYFRRARSYQAQQKCEKAAADYGEVIRLNPNSLIAADAYSRQAKLYADCADSLQRNPEKAIAAAKQAITLDIARPTYLTILASAYARNGQLEEAIAAQKKALASPNFPPGPGYRPDAIKYLEELQQALATKKKKQ